MKNTTIAILIIFTSTFLNHAAQASWLIDEERYHMSVHGQMACADCHTDISEKERHPDPRNVNRWVVDFFNADKCAECHSDTLDEIELGRHAGYTEESGQDFSQCIACHSPHEQLPYEGDLARQALEIAGQAMCGLCHEVQAKLPELSPEDEACMQCHREYAEEDKQHVEKVAAFCFECHADTSKSAADFDYPLMKTADYKATPHAGLSCLSCHPRAAEFAHSQQPDPDCRQCHAPHDEKTIREAHASVSCGACHLKGVTPVKDQPSGRILWERQGSSNRISQVHTMQLPADESSCRSCHFQGNALGAAAMVLPVKSVMCMPCHTATLSVGDTTTVLALAVFALGFLGMASIWFSGSARQTNPGALVKAIFNTFFSARIASIAGAVIMDGFFQRKLFRASRARWLLHALVFYPFVFRFIWGIVGLVSSWWWPAADLTRVLINKNHPATAFFFDLSGVLIIVAVVGMIVRRRQDRRAGSALNFPRPDWAAYGLLGGIILVGYLLEGLRMAMTGSPGGASWAFVGSLISQLFADVNLTGIYGYVWYLHAILTGVFVAYLPFSRMMHMITAPVVIAINAAADHHHQKKQT